MTNKVKQLTAALALAAAAGGAGAECTTCGNLPSPNGTGDTTQITNAPAATVINTPTVTAQGGQGGQGGSGMIGDIIQATNVRHPRQAPPAYGANSADFVLPNGGVSTLFGGLNFGGRSHKALIEAVSRWKLSESPHGHERATALLAGAKAHPETIGKAVEEIIEGGPRARALVAFYVPASTSVQVTVIDNTHSTSTTAFATAAEPAACVAPRKTPRKPRGGCDRGPTPTGK